MKLKMLQLLLLFLATGLFVSSEKVADVNKTNCHFKCLQVNKYSTETNDKKSNEMVEYRFTVAPCSYIFFY